MNISRFRSNGIGILAFVSAALFSTTAIAVSLTWQLDGIDEIDETVFSALMTFPSAQQPITDTISIEVVETSDGVLEVPVRREDFRFDSLAFTFGGKSSGPTADGAIMQIDWPSDLGIFTDTYTIEAIFGPGSQSTFTTTLTMDFAGSDLFNSLLTDVGKLNDGRFRLNDVTGALLASGPIQTVSNLTAVPEPWTLGLMAIGLSSLSILLLIGVRSRRPPGYSGARRPDV